MRFNDALIGLVLILGGIAVALHARGFPDMPGQDFGPSLLPTLIGLGLAACGAALIVGGLRRKAAGGWIELGDWTASGQHVIDVLLVIGSLVVVILLWNSVGFIILSTALMGGLTARFRSGRIVSSFVVALAATLVIDWGFRHLLLVPLPLGPLTGVYW